MELDDLQGDGHAQESTSGVVQAQLDGDRDFRISITEGEVEIVDDILALAQGATTSLQRIAADLDFSGQGVVDVQSEDSGLHLRAELDDFVS